MSRAWVGRLVVVVVAAGAVNLALAALGVEHDSVLVTLMTLALVTVGVAALEALESQDRSPWTVPFPDARRSTGEDTRTAMYRHVVEVHLTAREADETVVRQLADLAGRRLRQVHGVRPAEDPARTRELLGPLLAEWTSRDRRHRHAPDEPRPRYTLAELGDALTRIEDL